MTAEARLYDIRYSRYDGTRDPRRRSVLALARSSATRALGLRRTTGAKVWPFLLVTAAHLPVLVVVGIPLLIDEGPDPLDLMSYVQLLGILTPILVAYSATTLPSLLTRERRDRVLSLYFSTAVSPWEYLAGKVLAAVALMSLVTLSPLLILLTGSILTADAPLDALRDDGPDVFPVIAGGLVVALHFAALGLLAGSLTSKRVFAVGGLLGILLVTPIAFGLMANLTGEFDLLVGDLALLALRAGATVLPGENISESGPGGPLVWTVWAAVVLVSAAVLVFRYARSDDA